MFKQNFTLEQRQKESKKMMDAHPDRIPIVLELANKSTLPPLDKKKFLVPKGFTIGQFMMVVRKRIKVKSEEAIFLFINNSLPSASSLVSEIYEKEKDEDDFLYIQINSESTFG